MSFYPNKPPPGYVAYNPFYGHYPLSPPSALVPQYGFGSPVYSYAYTPSVSEQQQPQSFSFTEQTASVTEQESPAHKPPPGYPGSQDNLEDEEDVEAPPEGEGDTGQGMTVTDSSGVQVDQYGVPIVAGDLPLRYVETFTVAEKALSASRDSFTVTDSSGSVRYKISGSWRVSELKELSDIHGQLLLRMREARLRMRDRITIYSPSNVPLMLFHKTSYIQRKDKKVNGYLGGEIKDQPDMVITGNDSATHFNVKNALGMEVGVVKRKAHSMKHMFFGQGTYEVTVITGSPAFMCFMAVVVDEIYHD